MRRHGNATGQRLTVPEKMIEMMPEGSGDVLGDAAYGGVKNCNAIATAAAGQS